MNWKKNSVVHREDRPFVCEICKRGFKCSRVGSGRVSFLEEYSSYTMYWKPRIQLRSNFKAILVRIKKVFLWMYGPIYFLFLFRCEVKNVPSSLGSFFIKSRSPSLVTMLALPDLLQEMVQLQSQPAVLEHAHYFALVTNQRSTISESCCYRHDQLSDGSQFIENGKLSSSGCPSQLWVRGG